MGQGDGKLKTGDGRGRGGEEERRRGGALADIH
jgi:hypothetical protein